MKCKICGGTGTSNTCVNGTFKPCTFCDGTGECDANEVDRFNAVDFIKVMGMVKKPQTNEEWFCSLSTEEKANVIMNIRNLAVYKEQIVEWLKEIHEH